MTINLSNIVGGATGLTSGATFPASPAANAVHLYTTPSTPALCYWDTTVGHWLSVEVFTMHFSVTQVSLFPIAATAGDINSASPPPIDGSDIYLLKYRARIFVNSGGTALSSTQKWVGNMHKYDVNASATTLVTTSVDSGSSAQIRTFDTNINALMNIGTYFLLESSWTKTNTPGSLFVWESVTYRQVFP